MTTAQSITATVTLRCSAYDIGAWTDVLPEFGGDTDPNRCVHDWSHHCVATYRNNDFFGLVDGLNFAAQYQGKNDRTDVTEANGDGFRFSPLLVEYGGFGVRCNLC
ncbi:porin [Escherichia coli]|uniref:porin n=1 Tax=Escherichia coli TaxID=562 RepID=UPI002358EE24|nr:porin [Escherichia coli]